MIGINAKTKEATNKVLTLEGIPIERKNYVKH